MRAHPGTSFPNAIPEAPESWWQSGRRFVCPPQKLSVCNIEGLFEDNFPFGFWGWIFWGGYIESSIFSDFLEAKTLSNAHETHPGRPLTTPLSAPLTPWKFNSSPLEDDQASYLGPGNFSGRRTVKPREGTFRKIAEKNISAAATRYFRCGSLFHFLRGWYAQGGLVRWFTGYGCYGFEPGVCFFSKWGKNRWTWWKMWKLFFGVLESWEILNWKTTLRRKEISSNRGFSGASYLQPLVVGRLPLKTFTTSKQTFWRNRRYSMHGIYLPTFTIKSIRCR